MSTDFSIIRGYVRAALLDYDPDCYVYSDNALNQQIGFTTLSLSIDINNLAGPGLPNYTQTTPNVFDADLTPQQKLILSLTTSIRMLQGKPREFSYRSPLMSVRRVGGTQELINQLQDMLAAATGGKFCIEIDTDFNAIIQGFDRYINDYDRATAAWTGQPPN